MKHAIWLPPTLMLFALLLGPVRLSAEDGPRPATLLPDQTESPRMKAWRDLHYGLFIHFGMNTNAGEREGLKIPPATQYAPTALDVDSWVRVARDGGMKYAVLTTKHNIGFCLWDSKVTFQGQEFDYDVAASGNKTDVVRAFLEACKKYNIVPGLYYNIRDRHGMPLTLGQLRDRNGRVPLPAEYETFVRAQLTELRTLYPECHYYWIDYPRAATASQLALIYQLLREKDAQNIVLFNTHLANETGDDLFERSRGYGFPTDVVDTEGGPARAPIAPFQRWQGQKYYVGYEHCDKLCDTWFNSNGRPRSTDDLLRLYKTVRIAGGNLLLDIGPNAKGLIDDRYAQALVNLKPQIEAFEKSLAEGAKNP